MEKTFATESTLNGGEFLIKNSDPSAIFIPEEFNEEQQMIRDMCLDFVKNEVHTRPQKIEYQVELLDKAAELGLLGSHMPEGYGGMELDTNTNTLICEILGHAGGSFTTSFAAHTGIGMLPILYFGTEEQKQKYLPDLIEGKLKAAYCLTEPSSGSDALAAKTRADLSDDGSHYVINGQKMWISNAGFADIFIVFAKIDGDKFTGFIVERNSEGMTFGAEEDKMGIKGSSTRQVFFENVKVPAENLLGQIGKGHLIAFNVLNIGRFKLGALCVGGCKGSLTQSIKYANERVQFKVPISSFGAIQYKLAEGAIRTFALESSVYRISDMLQDMRGNLKEKGKSFTEAKLESAEEFSIECAIIKVFGSEVVSYVVDEMVQIHGGLGFSEEFPAAGAYRDSRINRIYEGTNEINRLLTVNMIMRRALAGNLDIASAAMKVQKELMSGASSDTYEGSFAAEQKGVDDLKKALLMVLGAAAQKQMGGQLNLKDEQEILMNIADIAIEVFAAESTLLRVQKLAALKSDAELDPYVAMLKVFLQDVNDRAAKYGKDAVASFSEGQEMKLLQKGLRALTRYSGVNVKNERRKVAAKLIEANQYCF